MGGKYNQYPKYHVAVDCVIFGYDEGELKLLLYHRGFEPAKGEWSLMGGFVGDKESSDEAAQRILKQTTGLSDIFQEQVFTFTEPERDPESRVISIGYYALIPTDRHHADLVRNSGAHWWPLNQLPPLIFDHNHIVDKALERLRRKARIELVGCELLPDKFTLLQLRKLYEAIFQRELDPANFRKRVLSLGVLERLNERNTSESRRGAYYYHFKEPVQDRSFDRIVML